MALLTVIASTLSLAASLGLIIFNFRGLEKVKKAHYEDIMRS